jgi:hypothetical protein
MQLTRLRSPAVPGKLLSLSLRKIRRDTNLLDMERRLCKREEFCGFCPQCPSRSHIQMHWSIGNPSELGKEVLTIQYKIVRSPTYYYSSNKSQLSQVPGVAALVAEPEPSFCRPPPRPRRFLSAVPQSSLLSTAAADSLFYGKVAAILAAPSPGGSDGRGGSGCRVVKTRPVRERVLRSGLWSGQWKRRSVGSEVTPSNFQRTTAGVYHNSV